jgi:hypothetical protein
MPTTVAEILKQSGFTDEQISAMDAKAITAFTNVLSTAEQDREAAEVAQRSNAQFYDGTIAPALNQWGSEKASMEAQTAYYRSQLESAKQSGFIPSELPGDQPRDDRGRYVSGAPGGTPGSPSYITQEDMDQRLGAGLSNMGWAFQEFARLNPGQFLPDPVDKLAMEASNNRLPFRDYVAKKYDFAGKQEEQQRKAKEAERAAIVREVEVRKDREWSERTGSNPDIRRAEASRYGEVARAVKSGDRPDPLSLNDQQRRAATSQAIRKEISTRADEVA